MKNCIWNKLASNITRRSVICLYSFASLGTANPYHPGLTIFLFVVTEFLLTFLPCSQGMLLCYLRKNISQRRAIGDGVVCATSRFLMGNLVLSEEPGSSTHCSKLTHSVAFAKAKPQVRKLELTRG